MSPMELHLCDSSGASTLRLPFPVSEWGLPTTSPVQRLEMRLGEVALDAVGDVRKQTHRTTGCQMCASTHLLRASNGNALDVKTSKTLATIATRMKLGSVSSTCNNRGSLERSVTASTHVNPRRLRPGILQQTFRHSCLVAPTLALGTKRQQLPSTQVDRRPRLRGQDGDPTRSLECGAYSVTARLARQ